MGQFSVSLREEDLYRGFLLNAANRNARPAMLAVVVILALLALLLVGVPTARYALAGNALLLMLEGAVLLAAGLLTAVLLLRGRILRSMARRTLAQRRELATPINWQFDEQSLSIETRFTRSEFPWDSLAGWREDKDTLLVYLSDQLFHSVPKGQLEDAQVAALRSALETRGVPRR